MKSLFLKEFKHHLGTIKPEVWKVAIGLSYEYFPWHEESWIAVQIKGDDPEDRANWKHYYCTQRANDTTKIQKLFKEYETGEDGEYSVNVFQKQLLVAAEALLEIDYSKYGVGPAVIEKIKKQKLNPKFLLQVYDPDKQCPLTSFCSNYCEFLVMSPRQRKEIESCLKELEED